MKVSTPIRSTIRRIFTLFAAFSLLFAATNLAAQEPGMQLNPDGPDYDEQEREEEIPPIQDPSSNDPAAIDIDQPANDPAANTQNLDINTAVDSFSEFVTSFQRDNAYKTYVNTYSIRGLRSLTDTLGVIIRPEDDSLMQEQKTLYNQVVAIEMMPTGERDAQSSIVQNAFIDAATLFVNVQRQYYPDYDKQAQQLARVATSIVPDAPIKDQTEEVNQFFLTAGTILEHMAQQPSNPIGGGPLDSPGQQTQNNPNVDPNLDPNVDPNLDPTPYSDDGALDDIYQPTNPSTPSDDLEPPGTEPLYPTDPYAPRDPLNPTNPVDPSDPLDPTDPMEPTPMTPARPFDSTNPEETAPLDF